MNDSDEVMAHDIASLEEHSITHRHQWLDEEDIRTVIEVLRSDCLTGGPKVDEFERKFAEVVGSKHAVAVSSGTAGLHAAMSVSNIGPRDEVIVPAMTFVASANAVVFVGGVPIFADVDPNTLLLDPQLLEKKISPRTKAIVAVDYAGQPCDHDALVEIASHYRLQLIVDACHALGGRYKGRPVGSLAKLNIFSFHPVKHITTGEGGMIATDDSDLANKMRVFRNHGINMDHRQRTQQVSWFYEMENPGYNYRLSEFQCALGTSQLRHLEPWVIRRQEIATQYHTALSKIPGIQPLTVRPDVSHAYHLYVIRLDPTCIRRTRAEIFAFLRAEGINVNVHYIPVHLHPFYRRTFHTSPGSCPVAEQAYEQILSLPIFPRMTDTDVGRVIGAIDKAVGERKRPASRLVAS